MDAFGTELERPITMLAANYHLQQVLHTEQVPGEVRYCLDKRLEFRLVSSSLPLSMLQQMAKRNNSLSSGLQVSL
jgi:hypothetical protein